MSLFHLETIQANLMLQLAPPTRELDYPFPPENCSWFRVRVLLFLTIIYLGIEDH